MGEINEAAAEVWRDSETDGVPASPAHKPLKRDIRGVFDLIQSRIDLAGSAGTYIIKDTRTALYADLDHAANTYALVVADSTAAYNGYYKKSGASGSGSWTFAGSDRVGDEITARTNADTSLTTRLSTEEVARAGGDTSIATRISASEDFIDDVGYYLPADNLYDPATMRVAGEYVTSGGAIAADAAWAYIKIPVTPGQSYAWASNTTRRVGSAFLTSGGVGISPSTYDSTAATGGVSQTRTAPATAAFLAINIKSNSISEPTEMMVNDGVVALPYSAYAPPEPFVLASRVFQDEDAPLPDYVEVYTSPNLYDPTVKQVGKYVASNGSVASDAAWGCTAFIPVTAGQAYTISTNTARRVGLAFYSAASSGAYVSGSYNSGSDNPLTATAPAGATHMVVNLYSNAVTEPTEVMIEAGSAASPYEPKGTRQVVTKADVYPAFAELDAAKTAAVLTMSSSPAAGRCSLSCPLGAENLEILFSPFLAANHSSGYLWNFNAVRLGGVTQSSNQTDDVAPYRVGGRTIGANHGLASTLCTAAGHGKTLVDVGSVWSSGGTQYVIVDVPSTSQVRITARTGNGTFAGGTLTHVSGATNTGSITTSAVASGDWFPAHASNRRLALFVDGVEVSEYDTTYYPERSVTFAESYDVLNKDSLVAWLETQAGTTTNIYDYQGAADFTVSMGYTFDTYGGMTIPTDFVALQSVAAFQDIMFAQAYELAATGGVLKYLVPDSKPLTHEGVSYDFTKPVDMTGWAPATRLDFTPGNIADLAVWPDRVVQFNDSIGMAIGYLPILDAEPSVRPTRAARKALQISEITKIYLSAVDSASKTSLTAGDAWSVVAYRVYFALSANRTACYVVRGPDADWLYVDWHASIVDRVDLPPDLHGRSFTVHRKSSDVDVLTPNGAATTRVLFDVTTSGGAGRYAILKFAR